MAQGGEVGGGATGDKGAGSGGEGGGERDEVIDLTDGLENASLGGGGRAGGGGRLVDEDDVGGDSLALAWLSQKHQHGSGRAAVGAGGGK